jgi:hypothetical protein
LKQFEISKGLEVQKQDWVNPLQNASQDEAFFLWRQPSAKGAKQKPI